ncbi:cytochrome oxidase assembly protein 1 [Lecanora helva]
MSQPSVRVLKSTPSNCLLHRLQFRHSTPRYKHNALQQPNHHRTLIAAPTPDSGPLMSRRSDRALPSIKTSWSVWAKTFPIFLVIVTVSALGIFNYQKSSSSIVAATLYALRTSEIGRRELGDEIYFRDMLPWIWGEMNQLHGRVDIEFGVKGTKGRGLMRFKSERKGRMGKFETKEWSLKTEDGRYIQLLDAEREDPFRNMTQQTEG